MNTIETYLGDCLEVMRSMADASIDAVVCDPPYGLSFMGKKWDYDVPSVEIWAECLRVLKPGGHLLAFAGTRTQHRMACRIEDAGFEIRDVVAWMYGSGFPKSLDVSKAIDKAAGAEREIIGKSDNGIAGGSGKHAGNDGSYGFAQSLDITAPATEAAKQWAGWGTALKPAFEPVTVARKPLIGTVAENVLAHGTGGLNIDGCRVGNGTIKTCGRGSQNGATPIVPQSASYEGGTHVGRWPANIIHDGSPEVVDCFPNDSQRFFYSPKVSPAERNAGMEGAALVPPSEMVNRAEGSAGLNHPRAGAGHGQGAKNFHPTVKPIAVMEWLVKLVTPPGATVIDPFMGSGTTGIACKNLKRNFIGIELDPKYFRIAEARLAGAKKQSDLF